MQLTHLSLTNFRNYSRLELDLPAGPTLLHGDNAQGKTNLLEAIYYLATTRSPQADNDQQLISWEADQSAEPVVVGRLVAQLGTGQGPKQVELRLIKEAANQGLFRREALLDRRKVRLMDLLGVLHVVLFLPEDVQLVTGSPSRRRRYLDITLCQTDAQYCRTLSDYNKVLEQRNALLRRLAENGAAGAELLPIYTDKLVSLGSHLFAKRAAALAALAEGAQRVHYEELTEGGETLRLSYLPRLMVNGFSRADDGTLAKAERLSEWLQGEPGEAAIAERFRRALAESQPAELATGMTRVGPHRDDWRFWVGGRNAGSFGSRGQQRSAILALKLAEIQWMAAASGEIPLLLLDEVVAELDQHRRALLLAAVQSASQALLTATDPTMFTAGFLSQATTMTVTEGRVRQDVPAPA
ncbi:MAG: DNA replication/repair protein RecF [Candidatus Promineifilaceae bacterium]